MIIVALLSLLSLALALVPHLTQPFNPFFDLDPEVMYISNALSWIARHQIVYTDHPGTPYILFLSYALAPFRLFVKFFIQTPFILWALQNISTIFIYSQALTVLMFGLGIFLFLRSILKFTKSPLLVVLAWLLLLSYPQMLISSVRASPEIPLFFIFSLWLTFLLSSIKKTTLRKLILLNLLAGVAVATKFTSIALFVSIPASLYLLYAKHTRHFIQFIGVGLAAPLGFLVGTWAIHNQYPRLFAWATSLATRTGIHGSGPQGFIDLSTNIESLTALIRHQPVMAILFLITPLMLIVVYPLLKKTTAISYSLILVPMLVLVFIFAKYSKLDYQLPNFFIATSFFVILLPHLLGSPKLKLVGTVTLIILLFTLSLPYSIKIHRNNSRNKMQKAVQIQKFIDSHPPKHLTLWDWGPSRDFAVIWGRWWSGEFYGQELTQAYPQLGELIGQKLYRDNYSQVHDLFSVCWDQIYMVNKVLPKFLQNFPNKKFSIQEIPKTDMVLVTSNHC